MKLDSLVDRTRASGLQVDLRCSGAMETLPKQVDAAAYRIIQEALTNVIRYAAATRVTICIAVDDQHVWLEMSDNGQAACRAVP